LAETESKLIRRREAGIEFLSGTWTADEPYLVITTPNWITDNRDQTIIIYFENKPIAAAAAAQEIWVSIAMPSEWDYDTFTLNEIAIGNQIFTQMTGSESGTWFLQQAATGEQIQLTVTYDSDTGFAEWYLRSYVKTTAEHFPVPTNKSVCTVRKTSGSAMMTPTTGWSSLNNWPCWS